MSHPLTAAPIEAATHSRKFLPVGFGVRFLVLLAAGFVWLIPAWWSPRLILAMFVWDAALFLLWAVDLLLLPPPIALAVTRSWSGPLTIGHSASVTIHVHNGSGRILFIAVVDETPLGLRDQPPSFTRELNRNGLTSTYEVTPRERGTVRLGHIFLRYGSGLRFGERRCEADVSQAVTVYPDLLQAKDEALYLIRSRQQQVERRQHRYRGLGREFESLREYRHGDEMRDISWTATARRHQLVTRTYNIERSQTIWIVLDAGRLMRAQVHVPASEYTKLDYGVNAALSVAQVASQNGDRVGMIAYGRSIQASVPPGRGPHQLRQFVDALAHVRAEPLEADHSRAARTLLHKQTRRALIVWITDFAETPALPDVIEYASHLGRRHLVLFAAVSQPDLAVAARSIPESETAMFRQAAAL
ncbi:MAG: DUF58 domain-containing protein, partial [Acidobacteriaceae bacterium]|nr:DUF58 domain-containing protein [Acidobacteriaceae bacterium]